MEMYQGSSTQQPAAICALKSPADAIHILEAVRLGVVPRVTRRLTGHERAMIRPGTVWVWEEEETNMRRWTDGRRWGASRVGGGGFLVYTESSESLSPPPSRSESPYPHGAGYYPNPSSSRRPESLIKQTYSTTMTHPVTGKPKKFHVVAYSSKRNPQGDAHNPFPLPHQLPTLSNLKVTSGIWPEWENRRENEIPAARRSAGPGGSSSFVPPPQSAPMTAVSSPGGPPYSVLVPPTAYPASASSGHRPPSPSPGPGSGPNSGGGRDAMYNRPYPPPPPPPFGRGPYDGHPPSSLPPNQTSGSGPVRGPAGPYSSPFQNPPRRDGYEGGPPGYQGSRHMSQPPMYPLPSSHQGSERFHPYSLPPRSNPGSGAPSASGPGSNRVSSYPPSTGSSGSSSAHMNAPPSGPADGQGSVQYDNARSGVDGSRNSPPQQYPFAYQRPSSSGSGHLHDKALPPPSHMSSGNYHNDRPSPEVNIRPSYGDGNNTDPRRYPTSSDPSHSPNQSSSENNHDYKSMGHTRSASYTSGSGRAGPGATSSSPNQPMSNLQSQLHPPRSETPSGRSPKMSISSTLLNHDGSSSGGPGLTLPPLRQYDDSRERRQDNASILPSPGKISPRASAGQTRNPSPTSGGGSGEDARQLGELGRRVIL